MICDERERYVPTREQSMCMPAPAVSVCVCVRANARESLNERIIPILKTAKQQLETDVLAEIKTITICSAVCGVCVCVQLGNYFQLCIGFSDLPASVSEFNDFETHQMLLKE